MMLSRLAFHTARFLAAALLAMSFSAQAQMNPRAPQAVSADAAQIALSHGAFVIDLRSQEAFAAGHIQGAAWLPQDAATRPLNELAALLSQAGADSSRTLLIVGDAGSAYAQTLWERLGEVASGKVLWLVGGMEEWRMLGKPVSQNKMTHKAVPQFLTPLQPSLAQTSTRMAGSRVRSGVLLERNLKLSLSATALAL